MVMYTTPLMVSLLPQKSNNLYQMANFQDGEANTPLLLLHVVNHVLVTRHNPEHPNYSHFRHKRRHRHTHTRSLLRDGCCLSDACAAGAFWSRNRGRERKRERERERVREREKVFRECLLDELMVY